MVFTVVAMVYSWLTNPVAEEYWANGISIGNGGDLMTGLNIPLLEIAVTFGVFVLSGIILFLLRGQILLPDDSISKYKFFGLFFFIIGQLVTIVPLILFSIDLSRDQLVEIARNDYHLQTINNLFTHQSGGPYGLYGEVSVYIIMAVTTALTCIGITLLLVGKNKGNLEGVKGGSETVFLAGPIAFVVFFGYSVYMIQNLIAPQGFFLSIELFTVFASVLWTVFFINQLVARFILLLLDRM